MLSKFIVPYLKSTLSVAQFAHDNGYTHERVRQALLRDLNMISEALFNVENTSVNQVPVTKRDRREWLLLIDEYTNTDKLADIPIEPDNRKLSDLTVTQFLGIISSLLK